MAPADNSHHLADAAARRRTDCLTRVATVLKNIERIGEPVSVTAVAAAAGVSRTFLYDPDQQELLARIRRIAAQRPAGAPAAPTGQQITAGSHAKVVRALRDRNRRLQQDNDTLARDLAVALGQLRDLRRTQPAVSPR